MRLLLFHPGAAKIDCRLCQRFIFDHEKGTLKTYRAGPNREKRPCVRPKGMLPPCDKCPKGSPSEAHEHHLSRKNWQTFEFYQQVRATGGACLTDRMRMDRLLMQNLAIVDGLYRRFEREQLGIELAYQVALLYKK